MSKVGIPKGMRDFSPEVMAKRNYIFDTIKRTFQLYGFEQIETPAMENRETLTGKYGEEGDRLIFSVLNSGDYLKKVEDVSLKNRNLENITPLVSEKALRYDLTVPFARYVVQHQNEITFPFKRFQIQPVWRADRPQKGRYREFYQCDADIIGSDSLLNEVELIKIFDEVLTNLGMQDFSIKMNNRKVLSGIAEVIGRPEKIVDITIAIDKLEKIGRDKVNEELLQKGLTNKEIEQIQPLFELKGDNKEVLQRLRNYLQNSEVGLEGIVEIEKILEVIGFWSLNKAKVEVDVTLARGLDYYTGAIFEVVSNEVKMGSICGGGRYADLTGIFGLPNLSGVGISFGADRIYDVMEELKLFPTKLSQGTQLFFVNFGHKEEAYVLPLLQKAREKGIRAEIYPEAAKMKKQMKYADQKNIPYVVVVGEEEMKSGRLSFKNMQSGEQEKVNFNELIERIS
ncbi:MAG: histidine--tRNA ligase [Flavobacteriales bacterium]|nr:histidine--tRNA ligase [Flavobacteriales bacterium]|tara:strand:- start:38873 stop:40237 length:1365 start_codon:yes stop_codon:yes gene_type:complete